MEYKKWKQRVLVVEYFEDLSVYLLQVFYQLDYLFAGFLMFVRTVLLRSGKLLPVVYQVCYTVLLSC